MRESKPGPGDTRPLLQPRFSWVGPPEIMAAPIEFLERQLAGRDVVGELKKMLVVCAPYKTAWSWRLRVPQRAARRMPKARWYEGYASFSSNLKFLLRLDLPVGSRRLTREEQVLQTIEGRGRAWEFETKPFEARDATEMAVLVGAMSLWTYLRKTHQVPGAATKTQANRAAMEWVEDFRRVRDGLA